MASRARHNLIRLAVVAIFAGGLAFVTCHEPNRVGDHGEGPGPDDPSALGLVSLTIGDNELWVEVADDPDERARGLMYRDGLPWDRGMLFIYGESRHLGFWMKNTRVSLSIAFIQDNGRIAEIRDMKPFDENTVESSVPCLYALEVNQGWFEKKGVKVGDRVVGISSLPPARN